MVVRRAGFCSKEASVCTAANWIIGAGCLGVNVLNIYISSVCITEFKDG
jgi:hypothetical protein